MARSKKSVSPKKTKKKDDIIVIGEETDEEYSSSTGGATSSSNSSKGIEEEIFYTGKEDLDKGESHCVQVSKEQFDEQSIYYTNQQLENLSREIRRHPSIALKSYHFLNKGLSTKILHQIIRVSLSALFLLTLLVVILKVPLPYLSAPLDTPDSTTGNIHHQKTLHSLRLTPFKENWKEFSIDGFSNFLCSAYNFNPFDSMTVDNKIPVVRGGISSSPSSNDQGKVHYDGQFNPDLKNIKIFGSSVAFGVLFFALWLFSSRLAEKEIIMDSSIILQVLHSILTIFIIPLVNIIFLGLTFLYFIQTLIVGPHQSPQDTTQCISRITSNLHELTSFSPLRELIIGSTGIAMRLVNCSFQLPISIIKLHPSDLVSDYQMKLLSLVWCIILGSVLYHFGMVISYLYSIFRERTVKPNPTQNDNSNNSNNNNVNNNASTSVNSNTVNNSNSNSTTEAPSLLTLDLKFLPSFIPEVLLTQNFIIVFIWTIISCCLWRFGSPIAESHEGEIFCIFLSTSALIQSIYQLMVILQKKDVIQKLHNENEFLHEKEE